MRAWYFGLGIAILGCGSEAKDGPEQPKPETFPEGITATDEGLVFSTNDFTLQPGEERFICYAKDLAEDAVIDAYQWSSRAAVHHVVLARTMAREPDGASECDVLFRPTWSPLFITTTADSALDIPEGAANVLPAGTQLLIQLHLLNSGATPVTDRAHVKMTRSTLTDPTPAGIYALGTMDVQLPPKQTTSLEASCAPSGDVELFAMMPHMHYLGKSLRVEMGPDEASLETVFHTDPYSFDDQRLEKLDLVIPAGYATRTTCTYENNSDDTITFGESSLNEMCFAIGFAVGVDGAAGCLQQGTGEEYPRDPAAGECADVVPNQLGVGVTCTKGGAECAQGLSCTADLRSTENGQGLCVRLECTDAADCGGGSAACCSTSFTDLCIPEACRPLTCAPK
jgi:hypothetical protein